MSMVGSWIGLISVLVSLVAVGLSIMAVRSSGRAGAKKPSSLASSPLIAVGLATLLTAVTSLAVALYAEQQGRGNSAGDVSAKILTPVDGEQVTVSNGFPVRGVVSKLPPGEVLWVLVRAPNNRFYRTEGPCAANRGLGEFDCGFIIVGRDPADAGLPYSILLVRANAQAVSSLLAADQNAHLGLRELPSGAEVVASVRVVAAG